MDPVRHNSGKDNPESGHLEVACRNKCFGNVALGWGVMKLAGMLHLKLVKVSGTMTAWVLKCHLM